MKLHTDHVAMSISIPLPAPLALVSVRVSSLFPLASKLRNS